MRLLPAWWDGPEDTPYDGPEYDSICALMERYPYADARVAISHHTRLAEAWSAAALDIAMHNRLTASDTSGLLNIGFIASESPIEALLRVGMVRAFLCGRDAFVDADHVERGYPEFTLSFDGEKRPRATATDGGYLQLEQLSGPKSVLRLRAQPTDLMEGLRPDFVIEYSDDVWIGRDKPEARERITVVVEADGHDFHERTKEQAERDRSRDRAFQIAGVAMLRFTGREIHRDPHACGREVAAMVDAEMRARREQIRRAMGLDY